MMMKLTVAFLGALAVADASNARGHRHVRRQYGYGNGPETEPVYTAPANSTATLPPVVVSSTPVAVEPPVGTTEVSPELPAGSSTDEVPGVTFSATGTAPAGTAPAGTAPGVSYPVGSGTAPAVPAVPAETSLSPVGGDNATSTFPSFVLTGSEGSFPTGVPSGVYPTGTGVEDLVTLTISSTQIFTVTACPSSVVDCPAKSTSLVTSVIAVGTTVCPESEASSIVESGLPSSASAYPTGGDAVATPVPSVVVEDSTTVMTQTIGTGANAHETAITITNKVTKTVYVTGEASLPVESAVSPEQTPVAGEDTTIVTSDITSTVAKTLTITEGAPTGTGSPSSDTPASESGVPVNPEDVPADSTGGAGECAPPVTVTVTAQETVTVTAGGESSTGTDTPAVPDEVPSEDDTTTVSPEEPTNTPVPQVPTGGAPYPTLNGTAPGFPGSSGFLTATKPSGAIPTGGAPGYGAPVPSGTGAVPSGTAPTETLPTFVLPSATPAGESPSDVPSTTSVLPEAPAPPAESSAYGPGYGYGSKKRSFFGLF